MANTGFVKASSGNLPAVDVLMIAHFMKKDERFNIAEVRGSKAATASRESYGDSAIGYVELKREGSICTVKCRICPEHKIRSKTYSAVLIVDEDKEEILDVYCNDCPAAAGGCKHALAFLMWVHRRSEDPAPTEVTSYWAKPRLSTVGSTTKFITVEELSPKKIHVQIPDVSTFRQELISIGKRHHIDSQLTRYHFSLEKFAHLSIYQMLLQFHSEGGKEATDFIDFIIEKIPRKLYTEAEVATKEQSHSPLWHELRFGRITASKFYEAAHCKSDHGTLVETVIGAYKLKDTMAMKRGRDLEKDVLNVVQKKLNTKFKNSGLMVLPNCPILGATPDGISDNFVVEIKCPSSKKAVKNYIKEGQITNKFKAQINLQMRAANLDKGFFCVASPDFKTTQNVNILEVIYDEHFTEDLISKSVEFWKKCVFKNLFESVCTL